MYEESVMLTLEESYHSLARRLDLLGEILRALSYLPLTSY